MYRQGAVSVEEEEKVKKKEMSRSFHGAGFRLGDEEGPSRPIGGQAPLPPKPDMVNNQKNATHCGVKADLDFCLP